MTERTAEIILNAMTWVAGAALGLLLVGIFFGAFWWLWVTVLPSWWPDGPEHIIRPGFWTIAGTWVIIGIVLRAVRAWLR